MLTFINEHKSQKTKNKITSDIECCIVNVTIHSNKYIIAEHIPISAGYMWRSTDEVPFNGNFDYYFSHDCIIRFARDLLEIESENNSQYNKEIKLNKEDRLYHEAKTTCHICNKLCNNKVRDHCNEIGKYRGPACKICNLRYKQENFIPVIFHNGSSYDFNLLYSRLFKQNNDKRKVDNIPLAAGQSRMFSMG